MKKKLCIFVVALLLVFPGKIKAEISLLPSIKEPLKLTPTYNPTMIKGMKIHPTDPFKLSFIIDSGDDTLKTEDLRKVALKQIKYFMASLAISRTQMWVNLSPYEKNRIINDSLGKTDMGKDMLAQDYLLKQLTASLIGPKSETGKEFWDQVYTKTYDQLGTIDISISTFNKVWIVPMSASIHLSGQNVFISDSKLKVMLEEDYLAMRMNKNRDDHGLGQIKKEDLKKSEIPTETLREVIVPIIQKEINEGKIFANLRQIYHAMILAAWYKENLKESLLGQIYSNQGDIDTIALNDTNYIKKVFDQYLKVFQSGIYDVIREEYDPASKSIIPRKYFSGGITFLNISPKRESSRNKGLTISDDDTYHQIDYALGSDSDSKNNNFKKKIIQSEKILKATNRPELSELEGITPEIINAAAAKMNLPVYKAEHLFDFHEIALIALANKIKMLLNAHEDDNPHYIVMGRDGEMIYDALKALSAHKSDLDDRVHLVNIGNKMLDLARNHAVAHKNLKKYLAQFGITKDSLQKQRMIFLDAGFKGSIFDGILSLFNLKAEDVENTLAGYLISQIGDSNYKELPWSVPLNRDLAFSHLFFKLGLGSNLSKYDENWGITREILSDDSFSHINSYALGIFLQVMPKFNQSSNQVKRQWIVAGAWKTFYDSTQKSNDTIHRFSPLSLQSPLHSINSEYVDPVATVKLQLMTRDYFSNPDHISQYFQNTEQGNNIFINFPEVISQKSLDLIIKDNSFSRSEVEEMPDEFQYPGSEMSLEYTSDNFFHFLDIRKGNYYAVGPGNNRIDLPIGKDNIKDQAKQVIYQTLKFFLLGTKLDGDTTFPIDSRARAIEVFEKQFFDVEIKYLGRGKIQRTLLKTQKEITDDYFPDWYDSYLINGEYVEIQREITGMAAQAEELSQKISEVNIKGENRVFVKYFDKSAKQEKEATGKIIHFSKNKNLLILATDNSAEPLILTFNEDGDRVLEVDILHNEQTREVVDGQDKFGGIDLNYEALELESIKEINFPRWNLNQFPELSPKKILPTIERILPLYPVQLRESLGVK